MSEKYVLAFDLGTGGNKSVLFDSSGKLIGSGFSAYKTYYPQSGWAEQKPMDWWKSIVDSTRNLLSTTRVDKKQIAALSISGHGIGVVPMSAKGELLRETTLLWSDSRAIEQCQAYFQEVDHDEWYKTTGAALRLKTMHSSRLCGTNIKKKTSTTQRTKIYEDQGLYQLPDDGEDDQRLF